MNNTYKLLDSGNFRKLEEIGGHRMVRPCPQAVWKPRLSNKEWNRVEDIYKRNNTGSGSWVKDALPEQWKINYGGLDLRIKPTNFGHLGVFAEQADNWNWLRDTCASHKGEQLKTLNLFAYTGGSSLAMAQGGAFPTHLDASKGIVQWARENAELNGISKVRWIVEDVLKFLEKEKRRGNTYDGITLDPPSYGRGSKGEIWKIEESIQDLLQACKDVMSEKPKFMLFSCHTPHFTAKALENLLYSVFGNNIDLESGEMLIPEHESKRSIPSGIYVRCRFR